MLGAIIVVIGCLAITGEALLLTVNNPQPNSYREESAKRSAPEAR